MDLGSLIIGLFLIACFAGPIYYFKRANKKRDRKMLGDFLDLSQRLGLKIDEYEIWSSTYCIGIDKTSKRLFYIKKRGEEEQEKLVNLSEVQSNSIMNSNRPVKIDAVKENSVFDTLDLYLRMDGAEKIEILEFYNRDERPVLERELTLIQKWRGIISEQKTKID